jgi:hypothetical protein
MVAAARPGDHGTQQMEARPSQIRVVLIGLSVLLSEIVGGLIANRPEVVVAAEWADDGPPPADVLASRPDAIIGISAGEWERHLSELLASFPRLRALALSGDGQEAVLCTLAPRVFTLGELSAQTLLDAIVEQPDWTIATPLAG